MGVWWNRDGGEGKAVSSQGAESEGDWEGLFLGQWVVFVWHGF